MLPIATSKFTSDRALLPSRIATKYQEKNPWLPCLASLRSRYCFLLAIASKLVTKYVGVKYRDGRSLLAV